MRIRTIKPEFWTDPFMVSIPHLARLIYISLFGVADDFGYIEDEPERVAMLVMPLEDPMDVFDWLDFFVASERLEVMVSDDGTRSLRLINFQKHQKVDRPTKSKIAREGSRKLAIPFATRRGVAEKYFCPPGESVTAECFYCGAEGRIHWHKLRSGKPSSWISFAALELDHHEPESAGGLGSTGNIVLACRRCNRSKGSQHWAPFITSKNPGLILDASREDSRILAPERKGKEQGREGNGNGMEGKESRPLPFSSEEFATAWGEWIQFRKSKRQPVSDHSTKLRFAEFIQWGESSSIEAIRNSIKNDYQGIFGPKSSNQKPAGGKHAGTTQMVITGEEF